MMYNPTRRHFSRSAFVTLLALLATVATDARAVTIDTVPVGNAGNNEDDENGFGSVAYDYRIGTTEVTVGQYTDFLNAVAATDSYALYNTSMATDLNIAGISRSGSPGTYSYSVIGSPDKPITYVSWGDAARFANWLDNGQPTGLQTTSTTEDGAYFLNGATTYEDLSAVSRTTGATWFLPTENEWYKAAYHMNDGVTANYWDYPTSTDDMIYSAQPPGSGAPTPSNTGNVYQNDGIDNGYNDGLAVIGSDDFTTNQNFLTDAGAYTTATSPYGTFDQGGNVTEWNEALYEGVYRGLRGGSWVEDSDINLASDLRYQVATSEYETYGFRVASVAIVPEPSTAVLAIVASGIVGIAGWWRKRSK